MRYLLYTILITIFISGCCRRHIDVSNTQLNSAPLDSVLKIVNDNYITAMDYLGTENKIEVCDASVTFDVSATKAIGGNLSVLIFKPGYTQTWNHETSTTFEFKKPSPAKSLLKPALTNNFQRAIVNAAEQFYKIKNNQYLGGLIASDFSIEVDFVVTRTGELDLALFNDVAGLNGKIEKDVTQKINLTFAEAGKCPK